MPIIQSAKKANRQNIKKHAKNQFFRNLYTDTRKKFEAAIKEGDYKLATALFVNEKKMDSKLKKETTFRPGLQSCIDKLVKKNIIAKNNASRKKAKFARMLKSIKS